MNYRWFKFNDIVIGRHSHYLLSDVQGINDGAITRKETTYIKTDGGKISDVYFDMRHFSITGHILTNALEIAEKRRRKLIAACTPKKPFTITYFNGVNKFSAVCYTDDLPVFTKLNKSNYRFVINITIPGFFWEDMKTRSKYVSIKEDMVHDAFILPMVFTKMYNFADIINYGDVETEPVITVTSLAQSEENTVTIYNQTTGKSIGINYILSEGEVITFDHANGNITSNINGNVVNSLIKTSEFWSLEQGKNVVSCPNGNVQVMVKYKSLYVGV